MHSIECPISSLFIHSFIHAESWTAMQSRRGGGGVTVSVREHATQW